MGTNVVIVSAERQEDEVADTTALTSEQRQQGLWRNCEDSIRHALQHFSDGASEHDDFHHRKWSLLSAAHAAEAYGNLLLCTFDNSHPPRGRYLSLKELRPALKDHKDLSTIEHEVFATVLKNLADQRNALMHEPAPERPNVTDAAISLLSLLHIIRRRTGLPTNEFFDQSPPVERDILEHIPVRDQQRWIEIAERFARAEYGDDLQGCDYCGANAVPRNEGCQACFSSERD